MHPRNPYALKPPNYDDLAAVEPDLLPFIQRTAKGAPTIDYEDENALRALTRALLRRDFSLALELPSDRLCPIIPGRIDYILWIQDLLTATYGMDISAPLLGCDIGTGATAIYPLLATKLVPQLSMVATELDPKSLHTATLNLQANPDASQHIQLFRAVADQPILARASGIAHVEFTMCNPPFYSSAEEMQQLADLKELSPSAVCTGAPVEMTAPGGEVGFVSRMVEESLSLPNVHWFTSLLGRHSSLARIVDLLKANQIDNYTVTEMQQGRTRRWAIAWTKRPERLKQTFVDTGTNPSLARLLPKPTTMMHGVPQSTASADQVLSELRQKLEDDGVVVNPQNAQAMELRTIGAAWSRSERRKRQRGEVLDVDMSDAGSHQRMVCRLETLPPAQQGALQLSWLFGTDRQLFESLWSHILRRL